MSLKRKWCASKIIDTRSLTVPHNPRKLFLIQCQKVDNGEAIVSEKLLNTATSSGNSSCRRVSVDLIDSNFFDYRTTGINTMVPTSKLRRLSENLDNEPFFNENIVPHLEIDSPIQKESDSHRYIRVSSSVVPFMENRRKRICLRHKQIGKGLQDFELLKVVLKECTEFIHCLLDLHQSETEIMLVHTLLRQRELAVMSCRMQVNGICSPRVGILWQFSISPRRAICLTFFIGMKNEIVILCSCNPPVSIDMKSSSTCRHVLLVLEDESLIETITGILRESHYRYFPERTIYHERKEMVAIQLKGVLSSDFSSVTIANLTSWYFSVVFETQLGVFVPVYKQLGKSFECQVCRGVSARRGDCRHEYSCKVAEKNKQNCDERDSIQTETPIDDDVESDEDEEMEKWTLFCLSHFPTLPPLMCSSICKNSENLSSRISRRPGGTTLRLQSLTNKRCLSCGQLQTSNSPSIQREMFLTTLLQGTLVVEVTDLYCLNCNEEVLYSVIEDAVFPAFEYLGFTLELLYKWFEMVCYRGFSFRMAYETTRSFVDSPSSKESICKCGHVNDLRTFLNANPGGRRRASDAFQGFITKIYLSSSAFTTKFFFVLSVRKS